MALAPSPQPPPAADPALATLLAALRRRMQRYVAWEGAFETLAVLGIVFWVSLLVDWLFEPGRVLRTAVLAAGALLVGVVVWRRLLSRLLVRWDAASLARVLERRFPFLGDSLVSAVQLEDTLRQDGESTDEYREMVAATVATARQRSERLPLEQVFRPQPWWRATAVGAVAVVSLALLAWGAPQVLPLWSQRYLQGADVRWPRRTLLAVEGFERGSVRIARGADLPLVVRADTHGLIPRSVRLRYATEDGLRGRANLMRDGNADPKREPFQRFTYSFVGVLAPLTFEVSGGDERIRNLRIEVVDRPALVDTFLACTFPTYLERQSTRLPATAQVELPAGTQVHLHARASKPLVRVELSALVGDAAGEPVSHTIEPDRTDGQRFAWDLGTLAEDVRLLITLIDRDGIQNQEPYRLHVAARADQLPRVAVRPRGVSSAVTPGAMIPVAGEIADDHVLARANLEYVVDDADAIRLPCQSAVLGQDRATLEEMFDVASLGLKPGQKLSLVVEGYDHCPREPAASPGVSDTFRFEIITPEALHELLESREVNLRRQVERLILEVQEARADVHLLETPAEPPAATAPAEPVESPSTVGPSTPQPAPAAEAESPAEDRVAIARLRVVRASQLARKDAEETRGIAASFDGIREELINNRLQTEELLGRLAGGIAEPLRRIAQERLLSLAESLDRFVEKSSSDHGLSPPTAEWDEQYGTILKEMRAVLERMKELETFNEAVARLRGIIEEQERLNQETQSRRRGRARELLEE